MSEGNPGTIPGLLERAARSLHGIRFVDRAEGEGTQLAYGELLAADRTYLRAQMQAYAASGDPEIAAVVRNGFGDLVTYVERVSGASQEEISSFFAGGMLLNVLASMEAPSEPWGARLVEGCKSG